MNTKVAILTTGHSPFDDRIFYKEAWSLSKAGFLVSIVTSKRPEASFSQGIRILSPGRNRSTRIVENLPFFGAFVRSLRLLTLVLAVSADVVHCHEPDALWIALSARLIRRRLRIVYEVREWFPECIFRTNDERKRIKRRVLMAIDAFGSRRANAIVSVETPKARRYLTYVQGKIPVTTIPNYPRTDLFFPSERRDKGQREGLLGFYSGGISLDRGLEEMLWLTRQINNLGHNFSLTLNGTFLDHQSERGYHELIRTYNVAEHVRHIGWIRHEFVPDYVRQADICFAILHPTEIYYNALPIKLFEYMACSRPVVASDLPLIREIVTEAGCGLLVDPLDKDSILKATLSLVRDENLRKSLGTSGLHAVQTKYNWNVSQTSLLKLYDSILACTHDAQGSDPEAKG